MKVRINLGLVIPTKMKFFIEFGEGTPEEQKGSAHLNFFAFTENTLTRVQESGRRI